MQDIPLIDWNGSGRIDSSDIAISLAMAESREEDEDEEGEEGED